MSRDADRIRTEVFRLAADAAWLEMIGSGPFRHAGGTHNPFPAQFAALNGPEALADLAARTSASDPELRKKWLRAIRPARKRGAKGRFARG